MSRTRQFATIVLVGGCLLFLGKIIVWHGNAGSHISSPKKEVSLNLDSSSTNAAFSGEQEQSPPMFADTSSGSEDRAREVGGDALLRLADESGQSNLRVLGERLRDTRRKYREVLDRYRASQDIFFKAAHDGTRIPSGRVEQAERQERELVPEIDYALAQTIEAGNQLLEASHDYLARRMQEAREAYK